MENSREEGAPSPEQVEDLTDLFLESISGFRDRLEKLKQQGNAKAMIKIEFSDALKVYSIAQWEIYILEPYPFLEITIKATKQEVEDNKKFFKNRMVEPELID